LLQRTELFLVLIIANARTVPRATVPPQQTIGIIIIIELPLNHSQDPKTGTSASFWTMPLPAFLTP